MLQAKRAMPSANLLQSQPQLAAASVKGYRELLRRLRAEQAPQGAAEEGAASTLLQQAKARVLLYAEKKRRVAEPLDPRHASSQPREACPRSRRSGPTRRRRAPDMWRLHRRRAFARLAARLGEARHELKEYKDAKKEQWRATVAAAVRGQRADAPERAPAACDGPARTLGASDDALEAALGAGPSGRALSADEAAVLGRDGLVRARAPSSPHGSSTARSLRGSYAT